MAIKFNEYMNLDIDIHPALNQGSPTEKLISLWIQNDMFHQCPNKQLKGRAQKSIHDIRFACYNGQIVV